MVTLKFLNIAADSTNDFWTFAYNMVQLAWNTVKNFAYYNTGFTIGDFVIGFVILVFIFRYVLPSIFGGSGTDD